MGERLPRPMGRDQVRAFFGRIDRLRDKALFSLLHGSGLRVSEALGLDIEDVNLEEREIRFLGKGDRERVGYLSEDTVKLLRRYLRERGRPRQGSLFESRHGTRLSYSMAWRLFRQYADGLEENGQALTIHQLRHSFGSERAGNMDALILRDLMGHKSLRTTRSAEWGAANRSAPPICVDYLWLRRVHIAIGVMSNTRAATTARHPLDFFFS